MVFSQSLNGAHGVSPSVLRTMSWRASAYQPGPAEELKMILPFTAEMASL